MAQTADKIDLWPAQVDLILSALEAGRPERSAPNRRSTSRTPYRVRALLRLFSDQDGAEPWLLYTRDVSPKGMGFITPHRLPLGYGGEVEFPGPDGRQLVIAATLLRCRIAVPGWFEGSLYFNREQRMFGE